VGDNGAVEFFDAARDAIKTHKLNPMYDSLLGDEPAFLPELRLLSSQEAAYQRDLKRARTSVVFLRQADREFSEWFGEVEKIQSQLPQSKAFRDEKKQVDPSLG
jgi:hypothetical protein